MKHRTLTGAIAATAAGALLLSGCASGGTAAPTDGARGALDLGVVGDVQSWDPAQAHVGHYLQPYQVAYDTLILREPEGDLSPMLATEWSYNEDNTILTLDLRTDVTFSDGEPFDADAVKANVEHFKAANGRQVAQLANVESVVVVDEDTVEYHLSAPDPALTLNLSQASGLMASPASLDDPDLALQPVGSGPYVMDAAGSTAGSLYSFTAREDYWNADLQRFDAVTIRPLTELTARLNALLSGQINATQLDAKTGPQAVSAGKTELITPDGWQGLLLIDRDGVVNPAMADVRVRQALNYAFDRETMLDQIQLGRGETTNQVFGPSSGSFVDALEERYPYDPEKARELLAEAGYADGLTLTMPGFAGFEAILPVISQQLTDVGITLKTEAVTAAETYTSITDKKFPMVYFQLFQGDTWVAINQMIATTALFNPFQNTTPELQELIDAVQYGGEEAGERGEAVNDYVTENAWFVPLYRVDNSYYSDASITVVGQIQQAVPSIYNYAPAGQ